MSANQGSRFGNVRKSSSEKQTPFNVFVDDSRGTVGFGMTYGENSYNGRPISTVERTPPTADEVEQVVAILEGQEIGTDSGAHAGCENTSQAYSRAMQTGSLREVANVLKGLIKLHESKSLSFREKKMLERARYILVGEIAKLKRWEESRVEDILAAALAKSHLRFPDASDFQS
jgi:hypothetical protein